MSPSAALSRERSEQESEKGRTRRRRCGLLSELSSPSASYALTRPMPSVDGTRYSTAPSRCFMTYWRSMILAMCSAMVASVPAGGSQSQLVSPAEDDEERARERDAPISFLSMSETRSASVRSEGWVVWPSRRASSSGSNCSPTANSGRWLPFHLS